MDISKFAPKPPMGWNSWDCFGVSVTEDEVKANADFMAKHLKSYGWEYVVVDLCWFSPTAHKDTYKKPNIDQLIDGYGRLIPCPKKFPSSADGKGFKPLADYIHSLGLKFGIHIMRGIPWQAVEQNTPILGSRATARDIAQPENMCLWYRSMPGVNMASRGAQEYYDSLVKLYAEWDVDFIKADDMNSWDGDELSAPYHADEIEALANAIQKRGLPIALSLSPGAALTCNIKHLRQHANMWRISADFWDDWEALKRQFERCASWAPYVVPGHWADADMLPIGKIGIRGEVGEPRGTYFTEAEQYTMMTLWCIFRSPLMFGGHLPESDELSLQQITNEEVIAVNQNSENNRQLYRDDEKAMWIADDPETDDTYLALFNLSDNDGEIEFDSNLAGFHGQYKIRDLWHKKDLGICEGIFVVRFPVHGAGLYRLTKFKK